MKQTKAHTSYDQADYNALKSSNLSAMLATEGLRFDSNEDASVFFARELDYVKAHTYDKLDPRFSALNLFPVSSETDAGAETITYYSYDKTGFAQIIHNYATDLPRADVKGEPVTAKIEPIGISYGYSVQEMRASKMAGKSLDVRKGDSARYAIDRKINDIAWAGDKQTGLQGVLSEGNNIPLYTLPMNAKGTSTRFVDKTPEECLNDVAAMLTFVDKLTLSVEMPDTLALPADAWNYLSHTPRSDASDVSIKQWILSNMTQLKDIVKVPELNANANITPYAAAGLDVAFLFTNDATKLAIEMPLMFIQHPVQPEKLEFIILCEARTAGAIIYYPLSALIIPGI
ncbi:MAG: DUF2184 domain-containing protein [Firmicutes bacterium]|nr:DUF2184 domain-containing protein [Bacillota bacterium]